MTRTRLLGVIAGSSMLTALAAPALANTGEVMYASPRVTSAPAADTSREAPARESSRSGSTGTTAAPGYGAAGDLFVLTPGSRLLRVSSSSPSTVRGSVAVTGLADGERLVGMDVRPANGQLYALSSASKVYVIDPQTGAAALGRTLSVPLNGTAFGVDFNPVVDRLRITSDTGQNLRANVNDGSTTADSMLQYKASDPNKGKAAMVAGSGYSNSTAGATSTLLYALDAGTDSLALQDPPNEGTLSTIGRLGINTSTVSGLDISIRFGAVASLTSPGTRTSRLARVNLGTGRVSVIGTIGGGAPALDIAFVPGPSRTVFGLASSGTTLLRFDRSTPTRNQVRLPITGLTAGDTLRGIDVRPATGQLYAVSSMSRLYTINPLTGAATAGNLIVPPVMGESIGIDFNPMVDRLRIVTDTGQNLRVDVDSGLATTDGTLAYGEDDRNAGKTPEIVAAGYENNVVGATSVELYNVDSALDVLTEQDPPNDGVLATVGRLGVATGEAVGLDVTADGIGLVSLSRADGTTPLYTVNLDTGAVQFPRQVGMNLLDIAAAPRGAYLIP